MESEKKVHQSNKSEYQIRMDGKPLLYPVAIGPSEIGEWLDLCQENPDCYVDIVSVQTEIVMSQQIYRQMKRHFESAVVTKDIK